MPATVQIVELNGAGATQTDKTSSTIRFKNADNANIDTSNPLVKPGTGDPHDWSFEKWVGFNVSGGSYTSISNIKAYTDGSNSWTGVFLWGTSVGSASYATPTEATVTAGYSNMFGYSSASPLDLGAGPYSSTGLKGNYLRMAMEVRTPAGAGTLSGETLTFAWDEI